MPKYVVERQYLLERLVIEADTVEEACEKAIDHDDWEDAVEDGDGARALPHCVESRKGLFTRDKP
jgi:hypothetical protein